MRGTGHSTGWRRAVVAALAIAASAIPGARAWCDLPFTEIVDRVETVILVEYRKQRGRPAEVVTLEVFKGDLEVGGADLKPQELEEHRPRNGSRYLVALTRFGRVARYIEGMGACSPVSVLPLKGEKLRAADRFDYDGGSEALTLEALREDLKRHLGSM